MAEAGEVFSEFAQAALPAYGFEPGTELTLLNVSENGTFRIDEPDGGRSVLRVHRSGYHTNAAIASELDWISALRADGVVTTPAYLPAPDGEVIVTSRLADGQERYVVRFAWVDGIEPTTDRLAQDFVQLGQIAARLHAHAQGWSRPASFTRFTWDFETALGPNGHWGRWQDGLAVGPQEEEILGRCAQRVGDRLQRWGKGQDRFGLVHADMRLANLLVQGEQVTVIDFDDCGLSWYLYDLGSSLSFIEHEPYVPELVQAWVTGYQQVTPLSSADVQELATFIMLRRLLLVAWIGSHAMTETAQGLGPRYTVDSCRLAEEYLSRTFVDL
ncbi:MAG: phosphotransferase enzyme family protein [Actinomycetales bacterium]